MKNQTKQIFQVIKSSNKIIVFTGAGISTESGISDYRSKGGLWNRFQPVTIQEFMACEEKQVEYWHTKYELYQSFEYAKPNEGHKSIAALEKKGKLKGVITQNIDGLHQLAGVSYEKIIEIHGNNRETICLSCKDLRNWVEVYEELKNDNWMPKCTLCGGLLKPNTISFGQSLDQNKLHQAIQWSSECDLFLAVGSTLIVEPAASMPRIAKENGAQLIIITQSETPLDKIADIKVEESAGKVLKSAVGQLE